MPDREKKYPSIDIIIPVKNGAEFVEPLFEMLGKLPLSADDHIIIIEDGSTDDTRRLLEHQRLKSSFKDNIRLLDSPEPGVVAARQAGVAASDAIYLLFLDIDDILVPEGFEAMRRAAIHDLPDIVAGDTILSWPDGKTVRMDYYPGRAAAEISLFDFIARRQRGHMTGKLISRELYNRVPVIDNRLRFCEDLSLMLQLSALSNDVVHCGAVTYIYNQHPGSICNSTYSADEYARRYLMLADNLGQLSYLKIFSPGQVMSIKALRLYYTSIWLAVKGGWDKDFPDARKSFYKLLRDVRQLGKVADFSWRRLAFIRLTARLYPVVAPLYRFRLRRQKLIR